MIGHLRHLRSLIKPRIVTLLVVTGLCALAAAGGGPPGVVLGFLTAGAAIAASAAAWNCWYDRRLDRKMERTADRPLPSGRLDHRVAVAFAGLLLVVGVAVGLLTLPLDSVAYMLGGFLSYVGLYTVALKRRHPVGVVLGGSAGSFPVLAGWTAVAPVTVEAVVVALLVFAWTPAHAWALGYVYRDDFAAAGVPTLPVVASMGRLKRGIRYSVVATLAVAACAVPLAGAPYGVVAVLGGGLFALGYREFDRTGTEPAAVRAFFTSNLFLATLFVAWGAGGVLGDAATAARVVAGVAVPVLFFGLWAASPALDGVPGSVGPEIRTLDRLVAAAVRRGEHLRDNRLPWTARSGDK